jgi:hypothetical protein
MSLRTLKYEHASIEVSGGTVAVRGLSLDDVMQLTRRHGPAMGQLFEQVMRDGVDLDSVAAHGALVLDQAPALAAEIIACGTGDGRDDTAIALARTLPFPDQIALIEAVAAATFATEGSAKKVVEIVIRTMRGLTGTLTQAAVGRT